MPIRPDLQQLEKCIDDALRKNDFRPLKTLLRIDICEDVKIKCSKQFLYKLDDLMCRELQKKDIQTVSTILVSIGRCGKHTRILGQAGLPAMIKQGLVQKMAAWIEKSKEMILSRGSSKDEAVTSIIEDFFDVFMIILDVNDEGKRQVMESVVPQICALVSDARVSISVQQEILKRMNAVLDRMPHNAGRMLSNQDMLILMSSLGERILDAGASFYFRVFTYPCVSAFLDKYELQIPSDEKLEEFWIDFNLGSQTLSFYVAANNKDRQWEIVTVPEETVQLYSIEVRESKKLLTILMKTTIKISKREGKELLLYFDASLEITHVTQKIFGVNKYKEFTRKQGISVAKTSVHILFDASGSQILVPESQVSPVEEECDSLKEKPNPPKAFCKPPKYVKNTNQEDRKISQLQVTTPSKRKVSEASMIVPGTDRYTVRSPLLLINTSTPRRGRIKPPLQMMNSAERAAVSKPWDRGVKNTAALKSKPSEGRKSSNKTEKHMKTANKDNEFPNQNFNKCQNVVPDSQPVLCGVLDNIYENKSNSKWACWTPVTNIQLCNTQGASTTLKETMDQDLVVHKKLTKQNPSSSLSDDNSEETGKMQSTKEIVVSNKGDEEEVEIWDRNSHQEETPPQQLEGKNPGHTMQSDWRIESETTFKSVLMNKTVEESLIYRKKYVLSKDVNTAVCDQNPSPGKNVESHRKSEKSLTPELNPYNLKPKNTKEKSKGRGFTDAAESLMSQIHKQYKAKDDMKSTRKLKDSLMDSGFSNRSDLQLSKEKVQKKSFRQLKTTFVNVTSECPLNDVYNFNVNGGDDPTIKLGVQEFQATATEACVDNSMKLVDLRNQDDTEPCLKRRDKRMITSHKKKHLFSDSETDDRCDDSRTDVSWLREPELKPQLVDYSRNKNVKRHQSGKPRPFLERGQLSYKETSSKNITKKTEETVPDGRTRLPRRAATAKKNYKDLSNSESESETEVSYTIKEKLLVKASIEKTTENNSTQDYDCITTTSLSPSQHNSSVESLKSKNGGSSKLPQSSEKNPSQSPVMENSAVVDRKNVNSVTPAQETQHCSFSDVSNSNSEKQFLENELLSIIENQMQRNQEESYSASPLSISSERRERIWYNMSWDTTHVSGPTQHPNRKRMYIEDDVSSFDEVEMEEEEERRPNLIPNKLSKIRDPDHTCKMSESISKFSAYEFYISEENWESTHSHVGMISEKINKEINRKIQTYHKKMDYFTKESWKSAQQHMDTMSHQVQEYRNKKLDRFQLSIIQEMENLEQESQALKHLEKQFGDIMEKILERFSASQKSERQRLHLLRTSFEDNDFCSLENDEKIFTSEQEEELLKVRRGLKSFMSDELALHL
ncbi:synaptonemal complex protein 2 [Orycteropus afer afer]|uniref:Synaptonemal complex protein 2 n=1 Tax=Orycteropus afer afer TaxID=1230840 RepID=A0AC54Z5K9_ORYAF|nr:synaptonemal complex protein 2 [Orycteropus afer afer]